MSRYSRYWRNKPFKGPVTLNAGCPHGVNQHDCPTCKVRSQVLGAGLTFQTDQDQDFALIGQGQTVSQEELDAAGLGYLSAEQAIKAATAKQDAALDAALAMARDADLRKKIEEKLRRMMAERCILCERKAEQCQYEMARRAKGIYLGRGKGEKYDQGLSARPLGGWQSALWLDERGKSGVQFHIAPVRDYTEGEYHALAVFRSQRVADELADELGFDQFNDLQPLDNRGNYRLDDNGTPFATASEAQEALIDAFSVAIEEGKITESDIINRLTISQYPIPRSLPLQSVRSVRGALSAKSLGATFASPKGSMRATGAFRYGGQGLRADDPDPRVHEGYRIKNPDTYVNLVNGEARGTSRLLKGMGYYVKKYGAEAKRSFKARVAQKPNPALANAYSAMADMLAPVALRVLAKTTPDTPLGQTASGARVLSFKKPGVGASVVATIRADQEYKTLVQELLGLDWSAARKLLTADQSKLTPKDKRAVGFIGVALFVFSKIPKDKKPAVKGMAVITWTSDRLKARPATADQMLQRTVAAIGNALWDADNEKTQGAGIGARWRDANRLINTGSPTKRDMQAITQDVTDMVFAAASGSDESDAWHKALAPYLERKAGETETGLRQRLVELSTAYYDPYKKPGTFKPDFMSKEGKVRLIVQALYRTANFPRGGTATLFGQGVPLSVIRSTVDSYSEAKEDLTLLPDRGIEVVDDEGKTSVAWQPAPVSVFNTLPRERDRQYVAALCEALILPIEKLMETNRDLWSGLTEYV